MPMPAPMLLARADQDVALLPKMANRHGLIAGAGKTITLRLLAEGFSRMGMPVFMADVKSDLSGLARAVGDHPKVIERAQQLGRRRSGAETDAPARPPLKRQLGR